MSDGARSESWFSATISDKRAAVITQSRLRDHRPALNGRAATGFGVRDAFGVARPRRRVKEGGRHVRRPGISRSTGRRSLRLRDGAPQDEWLLRRCHRRFDPIDPILQETVAEVLRGVWSARMGSELPSPVNRWTTTSPTGSWIR